MMFVETEIIIVCATFVIKAVVIVTYYVFANYRAAIQPNTLLL